MIEVDLVNYTPDPVKTIYMAYKTCYSDVRPQELALPLVEREKQLDYVMRMMTTGHTSPLEQVNMVFHISGVSRVFSHQFVRHRVGFSPNQQSQRYVQQNFDYYIPESLNGTGAAKHIVETYQKYRQMVINGVPEEDARYILPQAMATNLQVSLNLLALLHIGDIRLCTRTQREFRVVVAKMRKALYEKEPELAYMIQPKCGQSRQGFCDEPFYEYKHCPLGKVRPHKFTLDKEKAEKLTSAHYSIIEAV